MSDLSTTASLAGVCILPGNASGPVLACDVGLSFWGGVDPATGRVIDSHHPLHGQSIKGAVLVIPSGRGSCTGSGVLLELMLNGHAPAALVFSENEEILTIGAIVAARIFDKTIPVVRIASADHTRLAACAEVWIAGGMIHLQPPAPTSAHNPPARTIASLALTPEDRALLAGHHGRAAQVAMEIIVDAAAIYGADTMQDVGRAHIDGCIYTGDAGLRFARTLADWGGRVKIPTTLNAISVDYRGWQGQGIDPALGVPASRLADAYVEMGAEPTFTCAPYLLEDAPSLGEQIVWAESNAVVFANSVLGARTMKYPDYLDICIALTGRAPRAGCHLAAERQPELVVNVSRLSPGDDAWFPLLGYHVGKLVGSRIPLLVGLEASAPSRDDLKAFGAAFATTSAAPMFHIAGVTPEWMAPEQSPASGLPVMLVEPADLAESWVELNGTSASCDIGMIALGNPHFSLEEIEAFASLCDGRQGALTTPVVITCGRHILGRAAAAGLVERLTGIGVTFVVDTCWCMIGDPIIPSGVSTILTNSGKYAHYGTGLSGRSMRFGSLAQCAATAATGRFDNSLPSWLRA
jgi:predicted aconitase/predicted aconitase with swiveling domain